MWRMIEQHEDQIKRISLDSHGLVDRVKSLEERVDDLAEELQELREGG